MKRVTSASYSYAAAAIALGEVVAQLSVDVREFLAAGEDAEIPKSFKQAARLLNSQEVETCVSRLTSGIASGVAVSLTRPLAHEDESGESGRADVQARPRLLKAPLVSTRVHNPMKRNLLFQLEPGF